MILKNLNKTFIVVILVAFLISPILAKWKVPGQTNETDDNWKVPASSVEDTDQPMGEISGEILVLVVVIAIVGIGGFFFYWGLLST